MAAANLGARPVTPQGPTTGPFFLHMAYGTLLPLGGPLTHHGMEMEHSSEEMAAREERRLALSISEVALESEAIAGGWMCYSRPGCWSNQANAVGLSGPVTDEELDRFSSSSTLKLI